MALACIWYLNRIPSRKRASACCTESDFGYALCGIDEDQVNPDPDSSEDHADNIESLTVLQVQIALKMIAPLRVPAMSGRSHGAESGEVKLFIATLSIRGVHFFPSLSWPRCGSGVTPVTYLCDIQLRRDSVVPSSQVS